MKKNKLSKLEKGLLKIEWRDIYILGKQNRYQISNIGLVMKSYCMEECL